MPKPTGSPAFRFGKVEFWKLVKSVLLAGAAASLVALGDQIAGTNLGVVGPYASAVVAVLLNTVRLWMRDG